MTGTAHTVGAAVDAAAARLREAGVEGARRDARLLVAKAADMTPAQVLAYPERALAAGHLREAETLVARRARREPVSRIIGRREFWGLDFVIDPHVLDPRPDSEVLVRAVLDLVAERRDEPLRILDLGTGSGCLLLALLSELPGARGLGTDISREALAVAQRNAVHLGLAERASFAHTCWADAVEAGWQVIVSNPPYIVDAEIGDLRPEVGRFDPRAALTGGRDGLAAYRGLLPGAARVLAPQGLMVLEIGVGQGDAVEALLTASGCRPVSRWRDLSGMERCLAARSLGPTD